MSEHNHPVMAGAFLVLVFGAIGVGSYSASNAAQAQVVREVHEKVVAQIRSAVLQGERGDIEGAANQLRQALQEEPENTDAMFNLGVALSGLNKLDEAAELFSKILAHDGSDYEAMAERSGILKAKGDVDGALAGLEQIPPGKARMNQRLSGDPRWADLGANPRFIALMKKHGVERAPRAGAEVGNDASEPANVEAPN